MGNLLEDHLPDDQPDDFGKCCVHGYRLLYDGIERRHAVHFQRIDAGKHGSKYGNGMDVFLARYRDYCGGSRRMFGIYLLSETRLRR